jgi:hypothetical protein
MIEGELGRFAIYDGESPQEMYHRLKKLVNKVRSLGSKTWTDHEVVKRLLRAFSPRNVTLCSMIREQPGFKKMTPEEVLGKIINHEMLENEAKYVKSIQNAISSNPPNVALKANKKDKGKRVVQESSSSEEESEDESSSLDEDEMALLMKNFNKLMRSRNFKGYKKGGEKPKSKKKRNCYNCGKSGHFMANCPYEAKEDKEKKDKKKEKKETKYNNKDKKYLKKKHHAQLGKEWDSNDDTSDSSWQKVVRRR